MSIVEIFEQVRADTL